MKQLIISFSDFLKTETVEKKVAKFEGDIGHASDISVSLKAVKISDDKIYVSGTVDGSVSVECSRCLSVYCHPVHIKIDTDMDFYNGIVDMAEEIRQLLVLEMPSKPVCSQDCMGICKICGRYNKINDKCSCENNIEDDFIKHRWENLFKQNNRRK